ncbi:acyl carrier protein [Mucilaginibacter dorajii]|uniref:Carrier domain-containing protein n=1 Tax=Mucilaginibacter dorajii TaxID=692994 RepID=A0ABP7Q195_9SPHI|nr:acyl carrier protein [Mucilaginibacter dorajii]MCS3732835.1 acyl carrier protein [Mucilaginibacter dorajii]
MDAIETRIKEIIIDVAGLPDEPGDLKDDSALADLGFTSAMCSELKDRLNDFIQNEQGCKQTIKAGDITTGTTVGDVVSMVKGKLKKCKS